MKNKERIKTIYIIYLVLLFLFAMKIIGSPNVLKNMRISIKANRDIGLYNLNLIPFKTIIPFIKELPSIYSIRNIFGNIILFIPLGFFPVFLDKSFKNTLLFSTIFILLIEITQLIFYFGYFDIDDFILNLLGSIVGYLIAKSLKK